MKHLLITLLTLHSSLFAISAALPQRWDVDLAAQPPQVFTLQRPRGETYELEAVLKDHGKPFEPAITNACIYWQTNGMENLYWSAPASVSNNVLLATWLPSMDPGATTVRGYIGDPGHIYAAAFQFRFIASPGATPNELPLPQKVIDFAKVTVLNPPWSGGGGGGGVDTNAVERIANRAVETNAVTVGLSSSVSGLQSSKLDRTDGVYDIIVLGAGSAENANYASRAGSANEAEYASRASEAIADFQGNTIHETYAKKTELAAKRDITDGNFLLSNIFCAGSGTFDNDVVGNAISENPDRLSEKRNITDNTCHKTEYGEWVAVGGEDFDPSATYRVEIETTTEYFVLYDLFKGNTPIDTKYVPLGTEIHRIEEFDENYTKVICVQQAVCTSNKLFVTSDVVDGKVSAAVSTNNPAFVSAVRSLFPTTLRAYDPVRQCWWNIQPVNGVLTLTVED